MGAPAAAKSQNRQRADSAPKRDTKFKPGQSGNPGGRPKGLSSAIREAVPADQLARYFQAIWNRNETILAELGIDLRDVTLAERTKAGEWLADRGYGKAPSYAPVEGGDPLELGDVERAIAGGLDELAARRQTPAPRSDPGAALAGDG